MKNNKTWFWCIDYLVVLFEALFDTFSERIWPFLPGFVKINWLKIGVFLDSRVVIEHPRIKFLKFAANENVLTGKTEVYKEKKIAVKPHSSGTAVHVVNYVDGSKIKEKQISWFLIYLRIKFWSPNEFYSYINDRKDRQSCT